MSPMTSFVLAAAKTIVSSARARDEVAKTPNARAMASRRRMNVSPQFSGFAISGRIWGRRILADITSRLNPGCISPRGFDGGWQACLAEFGVGFQSSVQAGRIDDNRFDRDDSAALHAIEEAGAPAGMAGDTGLIDLHQQGVQVAIDPQFDQALHLA